MAQPSDHLRDHHRNADHDVVGIVHHEVRGSRDRNPRPARLAITMARGFMDAAMSPATKVFPGGLGMIAAR
jgi:hypothetical protein